LRHQSIGGDPNRHMIVHGLTHLFAQPASDATLIRHHKPLPIKVHREGLRGTFRYAGMAPLLCRAKSVRDNRETHSYLPASFDREQRLGGTGRDAGHILAEVAGHLVRKNHRRPVLRMERNRPVRTGLATVAALCASLYEQRLIDRAGRSQPIRPRRWWSRLCRRGLFVFGKFMGRFGNGHDRVLEKVAAPITMPRYMTPSARNL